MQKTFRDYEQKHKSPIEVKSSGYKAYKSLDKFTEKYSGRISERFLVYTKDFRKEKDITMLPMYMTAYL